MGTLLTWLPRIYCVFRRIVATCPVDTVSCLCHQAIRQGKEHYERVWPYTEPLVRPVVAPAKLAFRVGKTTFNAGKTAVNLGSTIVSTAMWPVVFTVKASVSVTAAVVDTGRQAVSVDWVWVCRKGSQGPF